MVFAGISELVFLIGSAHESGRFRRAKLSSIEKPGLGNKIANQLSF